MMIEKEEGVGYEKRHKMECKIFDDFLRSGGCNVDCECTHTHRILISCFRFVIFRSSLSLCLCNFYESQKVAGICIGVVVTVVNGIEIAH